MKSGRVIFPLSRKRYWTYQIVPQALDYTQNTLGPLFLHFQNFVSGIYQNCVPEMFSLISGHSRESTPEPYCQKWNYVVGLLHASDFFSGLWDLN